MSNRSILTNSIILKPSKYVSIKSKVDDEKDYEVYSYFPIRHPNLERFWQKQKSMFWTPQELKIKGDVKDFENASPEIQNFVLHILSFFSQIDGLINENLMHNFTRETSRYKEAAKFYAAQIFIETIHNEMYGLFLKHIIRDENIKLKARNAIKHHPGIKKIANWIEEWMNPKLPLAERVIAFCCIEGILFQGPFAGVYFLKKNNTFKELAKGNELVGRDEALHFLFGVELYNIMTRIEKDYDLVSEKRVHNIIRSAINVCVDFNKSALKVDLIGLNFNDMMSYLKSIADHACEKLGYKKIYNAKNPLDWMVIIGLPNKTNFFESEVTEYGRQTDNDYEFDTEVDF